MCRGSRPTVLHRPLVISLRQLAIVLCHPVVLLPCRLVVVCCAASVAILFCADLLSSCLRIARIASVALSCSAALWSSHGAGRLLRVASPLSPYCEMSRLCCSIMLHHHLLFTLCRLVVACCIVSIPNVLRRPLNILSHHLVVVCCFASVVLLSCAALLSFHCLPCLWCPILLYCPLNLLLRWLVPSFIANTNHCHLLLPLMVGCCILCPLCRCH